MLYYLGKGNEFKKENCKEYKTIKNALAAASKDEGLHVWDETGKSIGGLTDNAPVGALMTNPDGSVPVFDENGCQAGTVDAATVAKITEISEGDIEENTEEAVDEQKKVETEKSTTETKTCENEANTESHGNEIIIPQDTTKVTVVCDGTLNLRRSANWGNDNICGRASKGQAYYVKAIHTVQGKKMVQTIDDIYLSGEPGHVKYERIYI